MNNENPVLSSEFPKTESVETEPAKEQEKTQEETDNVIEPRKGLDIDSASAEESKEEGLETSEETQEEQRKQDMQEGGNKWDGFGDEELKIRKYREEYAYDLELEGDFGIKECEAKEGELKNKSGENNSEKRQKKIRDDLARLLKIADMKQLNEEEAALVVKKLELIREKCEQEIKFAKINYLLKLEECFNAEGDDRREKIEKFISEDHPNYLKAIVELKITITLINNKIEELKEEPTEEGDNVQSSQKELSKKEQEKGFTKKGKAFGKKAWGGVKNAANLLGWAGIVSAFGLSRIFSWKKLDELMEKWTKKKLNPKFKSGAKESK